MGACCRVMTPSACCTAPPAQGRGGELRKDTVVWIFSMKRFLAAAASALVWQRWHLSHALKIQKGQEMEGSVMLHCTRWCSHWAATHIYDIPALHIQVTSSPLSFPGYLLVTSPSFLTASIRSTRTPRRKHQTPQNMLFLSTCFEVKDLQPSEMPYKTCL